MAGIRDSLKCLWIINFFFWVCLVGMWSFEAPAIRRIHNRFEKQANDRFEWAERRIYLLMSIEEQRIKNGNRFGEVDR